ncbi:sulfite exporter TauE/SafE family protein [Sedimenticola selenatireducens]|uniref:Probable membrane transporter protein n=1 Tax=Sedimenticola selenatireducens TaxID=191960 RepID=A0A2N6CWE3_9GAMM|nr:sulfite exporter TauE/SafE family protein [Sedimenticola selenatireducens]PLX61576.1 MAG: hypothetical protein C0630_10465 [Sedimenticola selenatireducens]
MIEDPLFYLCAIPAVLIFGMSKGGFGGGMSVVSVPLMALVVPPFQAAAVLLPLLVVMDIVAMWSFRGECSKDNLKIILPGAILGILVATLSFQYLSDDLIRLLIGVIAVTFSLNYWLNKKSRKTRGISRIRGTFWGALSGFTSFSVHSGLPPLSVYMLPQQLYKTILMGTFAWFFAVVNFIKLIPYFSLGQFDSTNMMTSLVLVPLAPIGVRLGFYLLNRVNVRQTYRILYFFLFVVGLNLLYKGATGIIH